MASTSVPANSTTQQLINELCGDTAGVQAAHEAALHHDTRRMWREAVAEIAVKAKATLPDCTGRVDSAVKIVLAGDVELLPDGKAQVASQSNGATVYHIVTGNCDCKDYVKAPSNWCKHRIAAGMQKRAQALVNAKLDTLATDQAELPSQPAQASPALPIAPLPEAPVSITLKAMLNGHEVLVTLRGTDFVSVKAQVEAASAWLQTHGGQSADDTQQCLMHGVPMKLNHKDGRSWWSHKTADGWCKGK